MEDLQKDLNKIFKWMKNYFSESLILEEKQEELKSSNPPKASIVCKPTASCSTKNCAAIRGCLFPLINKSNDPDGRSDIIKSEWDILDWGSLPDLSRRGLCNFTPQTILLPAGSYRIELKVEDKEENTDTKLINFQLQEK